MLRTSNKTCCVSGDVTAISTIVLVDAASISTVTSIELSLSSFDADAPCN